MIMDQLGIQPPSTKVERRLVEKNRRNQMKILFNKLNSLLPSYNPKVIKLPSFLSLPTFFLHGDYKLRWVAIVYKSYHKMCLHCYLITSCSYNCFVSTGWCFWDLNGVIDLVFDGDDAGSITTA